VVDLVAGRRFYDLMYRVGAPWDVVGVRRELRWLLDGGEVDPARHPRAVDLGCGTGANVVFLAERGFEATGLDFSKVALGKARRRAAAAGVSSGCRFVEADLTSEDVPDMRGTFDLLLDFGSIDDLAPSDRPAAARLVARLSHPGSRLLFWCFYARRQDLPRISFVGPSRLGPRIEPGEEVDLFGEYFDIEPFVDTGLANTACFLLTRRASVPVIPEGAST
jgi:SAM-dependent methyltransferase